MPSVPPPPEIVFTSTSRVACDGATEISPALGHPRVYLQIAELGYADCGYCDKRFVLKGGPAENDESIVRAPDSHNK
ncbi:MAG TPA: zinc-finger domain-containing protein [Allosphingosinicella sp.]|jgi:uncharacterized Zn-finger protein|nr:zinc-finger domain-containing protein [Allosphingosinicella sp.]